MSESNSYLPAEDVDTAGFFHGAAEGVLSLRQCSDCGLFLHMPRAYCYRCGGWNTQWTTVAGRGSLYSWTVVEHQVHPAYRAPYTLVLVDVTDAPGVRLVGRLDGRPELAAGQQMQVRFEELDSGAVLPNWEPV